MDDLSIFCRQNQECPDYGRRAHGNLTVRARYGPHQRRLLYCRSCKARVSQREGTPLFDSRLPPERVVSVPHHIAEGCGVRQTSRLAGVDKNTVVRHSLLAGDRAEQLHDEPVALSPPHA
jgi:transposase-like protein